MKYLIVIFLVIASLSAIGQTSIPNGSVSGTWAVSGSPYLIQGNIMIPDDSTLVIEPGVTVNFQGTYKFLMLGRLLAIGTNTEMIIFTADDTNNGWKGIRFDNTTANNDSSKLIYCTLEYGNATGVDPDYNGGVLSFESFSKAIVSNCLISNNSCDGYGGAINCDNCSPTIRANTIQNNTANKDGGGIYCLSSQSIIENNIISQNQAERGGGIYCLGGSIIVSNNIISNNSATQIGGGIKYSFGGGGILSNNVISENSADAAGGGIYCNNSSDPEIISCIISNNTALSGAGISNLSSSPNFTNCILTNNSASANGGGVYSSGGSMNFVNSNVTNNSATDGGGFYCDSDFDPSIINSMVYGNTATGAGAQVFLFDEASDPNISYSDVQDGTADFGVNGNFYTGTYLNNINTDPLFTLPPSGSGSGFDGTNADWSLQLGSLCIDKGDSTDFGIAGDIAGNPRIQGCIIDIGAHEFQGSLGLSVLTSSTASTQSSPNCDGMTSVIVSGGVTPYTYSWNIGQTTSTASGLCAGFYQITVTDANNCTYTDAIEVFSVTGQNAITEIPLIKLFPNPTSDKSVLTSSNQEIVVVVYDLMGMLVPSSQISQGGQHIIDLSQKAAGVYIVAVHMGDQIRHYRLVKQ